MNTPDLQEQWVHLLREVASYRPKPRPQDLRKARTFAVVHGLGRTAEDYHTDPYLHAQVHAIVDALCVIDQAAEGKLPRRISDAERIEAAEKAEWLNPPEIPEWLKEHLERANEAGIK